VNDPANVSRLRLRSVLPTFRAWHFLRDLPRVLPYARPYWRLGGLSAVLSGLAVLVSLVGPWPLAILIDAVLGNKRVPGPLQPLIGGWGQTALLLFAVFSGLAVTGLENGINVLNNYVTTKLDQRMVLDLRSDMFQHASRLSQEFHDRTLTGQLMYRINNQAAAVGAITVAIIPLLQALATLVGMFVITYTLNARLALLALTVVPFIYYSIGVYATRIEPRLQRVRKLEGQSLSIVHEAMGMMRVVVAFGNEQHEYRQFRKQGEEAVNARIGITVRQTLFSLAVNTITAAGTALVLGYGAQQVLHHHLTVGELVVILAYVAAVYQPLQQISATFSSLQNEFISVRQALGLLQRKPAVENRPGATPVKATGGGAIRFEHVDFDYQGRVGTLADVSFEVQPGQRVAIVGPTGAGKTTLVTLIPRFFDPKRGAIYLDGLDLRTLTIESLRARISVVHQEPLLFSGSVADNIRYSRLDATMEEVVEAAKAANAHDFVTSWPKQYDTRLGERGAQLSGGERQRIAIARAFLKQAPILILDEPTSAIDSRTEKVILDALDRLMVGRTSFIIAHRLSTVRGVDQILVMDGGRLVEQGTHPELFAENGLYRQLYEAQVMQPGPAVRLAAPRGLGNAMLDDAHSLLTAVRLLLEIDPSVLDALSEIAPGDERLPRAAQVLAALPREDLALIRDLNEDLLAREGGERPAPLAATAGGTSS
jgi:ABC-type multidrug transport system fused ATPase/permease subunit